MIGEGIDYEKGLYNPEGEGVLNLVDDEFAREIIFSQMDGGKTFGYDTQPPAPPDNGEFAELDPNPGTGGSDSEIAPSYL